MIRWTFRLIALLLLVYAGGYAAFAVLLPKPAGDERTDAIVVLTGGTGRLERGFELMRQGRARRMLISGVARTVRPEDLIAAYHVDPRLLACCVALDRESYDTRSNADEIARWLDHRNYRSVRLVTNDLHMTRARYEVRRRVAPEISIVPDAVPTRPGFEQIFIEYNKFLLGRAADLIGI